jgi:DNA-binding winged helix-turn-helix (wHTH) protein
MRRPTHCSAAAGPFRWAIALLQVLVEQRGVPVSKDALMDVALAGLTAEESNLAVQIGALRRVFGDPKRTGSVVYL